jgi:ribosome-interacting GTPase 1
MNRSFTSTAPEVADFPHTTWKPTPGMMPVENIQVQLIDTPPLSRDYIEPEMMDLIRHCDLVLLMVDLQTDPMLHLEDTVALLEEQHIVPLRLKDRYSDRRGISLIPFLVLANKNDNESTDENLDIFRELLGDNWPMVSASVATGRNLDLLKTTIVERLNIIRIYTKSPGKKPDPNAPFVLKKGCTMADFAGKVHKDFAQKLKSARVWGTAVFDGQLVQRDYVLQDGDIVELQI